MAMAKRWIIAPADPVTGPLAAALGLPVPLAQVLVNRGFRDAESAGKFLHPQLRDLRDPFELPDMAAAVDGVLGAIERKQRIVIYGDYDVDGVTSSALLIRVLRAAGATVESFLPHRMDEGYGLSEEGVSRCLKELEPELLIAVDCGTSSASEIADLKRHKVETIVLDHHELPEKLPDCVALVNPKIVGRASRPPENREKHGRAARATELASVGVSFKCAHALQKRGRERGLPWAEALDLRDHLDLVAVGTVADIVPLTGENRILVKTGLERLPHTRKVGLRALMEIAGVPRLGVVNPYHIGFRIGPRLNAAGRLGDATAALELLLTENPAEAGRLAELLNDHNAKRQQIEERIVREATEMVRADADLNRARVLVLARDGWHVGVIGIVASRVQQEFYRPTVVIGTEHGIGKGSCRSIAGFSIVDALAHCAPLLERFGGHEMAAGLSVKAENIPELRRALNDYAAGILKDEDWLPQVRVDAVIRLDDLDEDFFAQLERLEPCGPENPLPVFAVRGAKLRGVPRVVGKPRESIRGGDHLKFNVTDGGTTVEAIWFGKADCELPAATFDIAFVPEINEFRGAQTVQLKVKDVRPVL
jgi:single-stranded-DNA-specific exonuclease